MTTYVNLAAGVHDTSPLGTGHNWVTDNGGFPPYLREIAHALIRRGAPKSKAIQIAIGTLRRWAAGGDNVTAETRAKAAAALVAYEALRARARANPAG